MRTVRCSDRRGGVHLVGGVPTQWGVPAGEYLPSGVYTCQGGVPSRGCIPACTEADTPLWTEWQTGVKTLPCRNFVADGNNPAFFIPYFQCMST